MNKCCDCKKEKTCRSREGSHKYCFEPKPQTNFDRIKNMSIEEMAVAIDKLTCNCVSSDGCEDCPIYNGGHYCRPQDIMKWLESEVSNNG